MLSALSRQLSARRIYAEFSQPQSVGEVAQFDALRLRFQQSLSQRRNVRLDKPDASIIGINRYEYRGRLLQKRRCRDGSVSPDRDWVRKRTRISTSARSRPALLVRSRLPAT